jgi:4'-phosphopantetheinyl transferase
MATRGVLAGYLGVSPPEVIIRRDCERCGGAHGRPRVDGEDVEFSVSHSRTWFGIAVSRGIRIGFDVEPVTSGQLSNRAMTGLFGPEERQAFACLPPGDRSVAIARAWTRKEAVSKLTGLGLAARFRELDVRESHLIVRVGRSSSPPTGVALLDVPGPAGHVATLARTADHRPDPEPGLARNPRAGPAE